jgi:hypothetical protein
MLLQVIRKTEEEMEPGMSHQHEAQMIAVAADPGAQQWWWCWLWLCVLTLQSSWLLCMLFGCPDAIGSSRHEGLHDSKVPKLCCSAAPFVGRSVPFCSCISSTHLSNRLTASLMLLLLHVQMTQT